MRIIDDGHTNPRITFNTQEVIALFRAELNRLGYDDRSFAAMQINVDLGGLKRKEVFHKVEGRDQVFCLTVPEVTCMVSGIPDCIKQEAYDDVVESSEVGSNATAGDHARGTGGR